MSPAPPEPIVSIIVAAWKPDPVHFDAALRSALAQTWSALEVLVADDSPNGDAHPIVERLGDPRLQYVRRNPQLGVARNHWEAFRQARGEYIAVLNHDDLLAPSFVTRLAGSLQAEPNAVLAFCDHWLIDSCGRSLYEETRRNTIRWGRNKLQAGLHQPAHALVVQQSLPIAMGTVFRRAALPENLPDEAGPAYDFWLGHLLCRNGQGVWYEPERLSSWRVHDASLTHAAGPDWLEGSALCWADIASDPCYANLHPHALQRAALAFRSASTAAIRFGQSERARELAVKSFALDGGWKALAAAGISLLPSALAKRVLGVLA